MSDQEQEYDSVEEQSQDEETARQELKSTLKRFTELSQEKRQLMDDLKDVKSELAELQEPLISFLVESDQPGFQVGEDKVLLKRKAPKKKSVNKQHIEGRLAQYLKGDIVSAQEAVAAIYSDLEIEGEEGGFSLDFRVAKKQKKQEFQEL